MPFHSLTEQPADPLLGLIGAFRADARPGKIDLGVGVFRDADGKTPVMAAVKAAERRLVETQPSKSYLGPEGDERFVHLLGERVFADAVPAERRTGLQTPGGTGALRLGAELLVLAGVQRIWIGQPSWANHAPVFAQAGLTPVMHAMFDLDAQRVDVAAMRGALNDAQEGDAILLHGCCHNPLGIDPDAEDWAAITSIVAERRLLPFVDLAYQGLGDGWVADAAGTRALLSRVPFGLLAYSCDKNFGLYRERVGALWALAEAPPAVAPLSSNLLALARANWSMPPDHGAAVVRLILEDAALTAMWEAELDAMRVRIASIRKALADLGQVGGVDLARLREGRGMFATLPLERARIGWLRAERAIYMAGSGRINLAGFTGDAVARFGAALAESGEQVAA